MTTTTILTLDKNDLSDKTEKLSLTLPKDVASAIAAHAKKLSAKKGETVTASQAATALLVVATNRLAALAKYQAKNPPKDAPKKVAPKKASKKASKKDGAK